MLPSPRRSLRFFRRGVRCDRASLARFRTRPFGYLGIRRPRMNVLLLTPYLPTPPRFGAHRRIHGLMREIAARHDVSVLSFVDTHAPPAEIAESRQATGEYCRSVVTVPNPRVGAPSAQKRALQLLSVA